MSKLALEIFRDADSPTLSTEIVHSGLEIIGRSTNAIEVVQDTRRVRIARPGQKSIDTSRIRWPAFSADMNVVITDRDLYVPPEQIRELKDLGTLGLAEKDLGLAIINIACRGCPELAVAHEIGHLLGIKSRGKTYNGVDHCTGYTCAMYPVNSARPLNPAAPQPPRAKSFISGWLEQHGLKEPPPPPSAFCGECEYQLDEAAFYLGKAKDNDYTTPYIPSMLQPSQP